MHEQCFHFLGVELLDYVVDVHLTFFSHCHIVFQSGCAFLHFHQQCIIFIIPLCQYSVWTVKISHSSEYIESFNCTFDFHIPDGYWGWIFFLYAYLTLYLYTSLVKCLFKSWCPFFLFFYWVVGFLNIQFLKIHPGCKFFIWYVVCKHFLPV